MSNGCRQMSGRVYRSMRGQRYSSLFSPMAIQVWDLWAVHLLAPAKIGSKSPRDHLSFKLQRTREGSLSSHTSGQGEVLGEQNCRIKSSGPSSRCASATNQLYTPQQSHSAGLAWLKGKTRKCVIISIESR